MSSMLKCTKPIKDTKPTFSHYTTHKQQTLFCAQLLVCCLFVCLLMCLFWIISYARWSTLLFTKKNKFVCSEEERENVCNLDVFFCSVLNKLLEHDWRLIVTILWFFFLFNHGHHHHQQQPKSSCFFFLADQPHFCIAYAYLTANSSLIVVKLHSPFLLFSLSSQSTADMLLFKTCIVAFFFVWEILYNFTFLTIVW